MIDEASFKAGMEKMRADLAPMAAETGEDGASARCMILAGESMHRFITSEFDRNTPPEQIEHALAVFVANIFSGFAANFEYDTEDGAKNCLLSFVNKMANVALELIRIGDDLDESKRTDIKYTEGGRA